MSKNQGDGKEEP